MLRAHFKHTPAEILGKLYQNITKSIYIYFYTFGIVFGVEFLILDVNQQDHIRSLQTVVISVKCKIL